MERARKRGNELELIPNLASLGLTLLQMGDIEAAEPLFRERVDLDRKQLARRGGKPFRSLAYGLINLGWLYHLKADYAAAEPLFREAVAMEREVVGDAHLSVANFMSYQALLYTRTGDYAEAESLFHDILARYRADKDRENVRIATRIASVLYGLGRLHHAKGDYAAADSLLREAQAIYRAKRGDADPAVTLLQAQVLIEQGKPEQAEPLLREVLRFRQEQQEEGHWETAEAKVALGTCLTALQRYDEAEALLVEGRDVLKAVFAANHPLRQQAEEALIHLYQAWDKPAPAA